ncbi:MAG: calcium/sodium antiporter [Oscillospiraceae bacterium]|jgi:cation:H+ antiporter|nr:calcium/sodium antiporter [Oscillospiraceae bacterium]
MILTIALFVLGTILVIKGSDVFVDAAGWTADVTGISRVVIGATVVSVATTSPEYFVSTIAVIKGYNDLSIGNAVGSLSVNLGVGLGLLALFTPGKIGDRLFWVKGLLMILSAASLWVFCLNGAVSVWEAVILLALFGISIFINIRFARDGDDCQKRQTNRREIILNVLKFAGGAAAVVFGSNLMVDGGKAIAEQLGISEAVIGLTVVAIGTSLPEIATSVTAIIKKQSALSIGNIVGANILDTTLILATGSFISGGALAVSEATVRIDLPVALLLMLAAVLPAALGKRTFRWQGASIMAIYLAYLIYLVMRAAV